MQKITSFLMLLLSTFLQAQTVEGTYFALEINGLMVDTSGTVYFYMQDRFPKEKWFHEVKVVIKGSNITITKYPISYDSLGKKWYSASDGGFLTYKGTITKSGDLYVAKTALVDYDYIGVSYFEPPKIANDIDSNYIDTVQNNGKNLSLTELRKTHDVTKDVRGIEVFLPKGTLRQDYLIRPDKGGLWINNVFYYRRKKQSA
jgi:hypothetical protein